MGHMTANRLARVTIACGLMLSAAAVASVAADGNAAATGPSTRPTTTRPWRSVAFADPGDAKRIVFVCDASGSMIGKMSSLKNELRLAIEDLQPQQRFGVVFFQDDRAVYLSKSELLPVTARNKASAMEFLDEVTTTSTSEPTRALRFAFARRPDVVYFVTDGDFPENNHVRSEVWRLNYGLRARVNTVHLFNQATDDASLSPLLKKIAADHRGDFRRIDEPALSNQANRDRSKAIVERVGPDGRAATTVAADPATRRVSDRPPASEFPPTTNAARVVFVCNVTPVVADALPTLKRVLKAAVLRLRQDQAFNIIVMRRGAPALLTDGNLFSGTDERKEQAFRFIDRIQVEDDPDTGTALATTWAIKPAMVIFIGDEWMEHAGGGNARDPIAGEFMVSFVPPGDPTAESDHGSNAPGNNPKKRLWRIPFDPPR
jgi:hypothetical protein